jgi:hypothetical protein
MFIRCFATALVLSSVALLPASAGAAGISFAPLTRAISASDLGKHDGAMR